MNNPAVAKPDDTAAQANPVEMITVGCSLTMAEGFANALRNMDQATHLRVADDTGTLVQQLRADPSGLLVVNADSIGGGIEALVSQIRDIVPTASIILLSRSVADFKDQALSLHLQDLVVDDDPDRVALAVRREHLAQGIQAEMASLQRKLEEAEKRSNQLVQSSRDAIAYIHEGMYLATNQAYLDLFGFESDEDVDGLPIMDSIEAESRGDFKAALRQVDIEGKHVQEFRCVSTDDQPFLARMEFLPATIDGERCTQVIIRDQSQNLALQRRIDELTNKDAQTGFLNRQAFLERLESLLQDDNESDLSALIQVEVSNFTEVRDSCGFACAEKMLTEIASVIAATVTESHTVSRFGDHAFMILCASDESPLDIAERCLHNLRGYAFRSVQDADVMPSYAFGVTRSDDQEITPYELVNQSCRATRIADAEGGNRVVFYNPQMPSETSQLDEEEAAIVERIDHALANDGFRLKFQPIVSLQGDTRENYSVYLRLLDQDGEELVPDVFLSPANQASRLAEIDRWVVRQSIQELASHRREGQKVVFHLIMSAAGIRDDSMLLWICDCLREFRAKGSWLVFQFRENDLHTALRQARELIEGLKQVNCRIAISHYTDATAANLDSLKEFGIDFVKLSPEYMHNLATSPAQQEQMQAAHNLLHAQDYQTVACGLEDADSLAVLWNIGVNYIQGYFLQKPESTITFEEASE